MNAPQEAPSLGKFSITLKVFSVGFMGVMLISASCMISSVVSARQESWNQIREGLVATWGASQDVVGPILRVPVTIEQKDEKGRPTFEDSIAWFLPERLSVDGEAGTELLRHGICKTSVYSTDLRLAGSFPADVASVLAQHAMRPKWSEARVLLGVSDLRGIKSAMVLEWDGEKLPLEPSGESLATKGGVLEARLPREPRGATAFATTLKVRGSQGLGFLPLGKTTAVSLRSTWRSPEFVGPYAPDAKDVGPDGFRAAWKIQHINRNIPQFWAGDARDLSASRFGVDFAVPVDYYRATSRAVQYATMFIFLTLVVFFFVEFFQRRRLHPIQYLLVGSGIVLFYLLLLSLAEHVSFPLAYALASAAIVIVIASYSHWVFQRKAVTAAVGGILSGLYSFFYTLLQMEEYSLLLGSFGLLLALALVMFLTRDFEWYALERAPEA